jgi:hypothetical protein
MQFRKLDPNLYRYPGVAFALQFWGIHGKKGLRKRFSTIELTDEGKTQASGHSLKIETDKEGRRTIYLDLPTDPDLDMLEFRRALYRIARSARWPCWRGRTTRWTRNLMRQGDTFATQRRERLGHSHRDRPRSPQFLALRSFTTLRRAGERSSFFNSLTTSSPSLCATIAPSPRMPPRRGTS